MQIQGHRECCSRNTMMSRFWKICRQFSLCCVNWNFLRLSQGARWRPLPSCICSQPWTWNQSLNHSGFIWSAKRWALSLLCVFSFIPGHPDSGVTADHSWLVGRAELSKMRWFYPAELVSPWHSLNMQISPNLFDHRTMCVCERTCRFPMEPFCTVTTP